MVCNELFRSLALQWPRGARFTARVGVWVCRLFVSRGDPPSLSGGGLGLGEFHTMVGRRGHGKGGRR